MNEKSPCQLDMANLASKFEYTPLHVAAFQDDTVVTTLLINKKAKTEAKNDKNQTALHLAAQSGSTNNVIMLMYEGNANVLAKDKNGETPLHLAKTSRILNILLSKVKAIQLVNLEMPEEFQVTTPNSANVESPIPAIVNSSSRNQISVNDLKKTPKKSLFDRVLNKHPTSMKNYLDVMIWSQSGHYANIDDQHFVFDLSIFDYDTHVSNSKIVC